MAFDLKTKLAAFKSTLGGGPQADEITNSLLGQIADLHKDAISKGLVTKEVGDEAEAAASGEPVGQVETEAAGEDDVADNFIGDMSVSEFVPFMASLLKAGGVAPVTKEMITAAVSEALAAPTAATTKAASDTAALLSLVQSMAGQISAMQVTIKELTSDEPRVMRNAFIASRDNETVKSIDLTGPKIDEIDQIAAHVATSWGGQS